MGSVVKLALKYGVAFMVGAGAMSKVSEDRNRGKKPDDSSVYLLGGVAVASYYLVKKVL